MSIQPRLARTIVLLAWAGFLGGIWFTGETARYLGPWTWWVVPFGAATLAAATLASGVSALRSRREPAVLTTRDAAGLLVLLVPILAVALVPKAQLGSAAALKKLGDQSRAAVVSRLAPRVTPGKKVDANFFSIASANVDPKYAAVIGMKTGTPAHLIGFVIDSKKAPAGTFELGRFYIACCAADALPLTVPVDPSRLGAGVFKPDTWLDVTGSLSRREGRFVLVASRITPVEPPNNPYLSAYTE